MVKCALEFDNEGEKGGAYNGDKGHRKYFEELKDMFRDSRERPSIFYCDDEKVYVLNGIPHAKRNFFEKDPGNDHLECVGHDYTRRKGPPKSVNDVKSGIVVSMFSCKGCEHYIEGSD